MHRHVLPVSGDRTPGYQRVTLRTVHLGAQCHRSQARIEVYPIDRRFRKSSRVASNHPNHDHQNNEAHRGHKSLPLTGLTH
jgi:hypothetical protein